MRASALREVARRWLAEGRPAVQVIVHTAQGSVPRGAGTLMLVSPREVAGTIGGGHLELQAIDTARSLLASGGSAESLRRLDRHFPLGPALGQCCGGAVTLRFEALTDAHLGAWPADAPRLHLQLYGAGHVGRAIARLLATLEVSVDWIDEREDEFPSALLDGAWPPHIQRVAVDGVAHEVRRAPPGSCFLVLTHRHDLDLRIAEAILRRGDFAFFGMIGSKTKRQKFIHRFETTGLAADRIARMTCPIGAPGIAGKEPEVIAVAVVAQLLALPRTSS